MRVSALLLALAVSCADHSKTELQPDEIDKFTTIYAELSIAFEMAGQDSAAYFAMRDSILQANDVDTAWVNGVTRKLGEDVESWLGVWEEITGKLEAKKDSLTR